MSQARGIAELTELRELWQRWTTIVAYFAHSRKGRNSISSDDYRELHGRLIRACQAAVGAVDESKQAPLQRIETFVRPWVTLDALARAGRKNAVGILGQCPQLDGVFCELPARSRWTPAAAAGGGKRKLFILLTVFVIGIGITLAVLNWDDYTRRMSPMHDARLWLVWLNIKVQQAGFFKVFSVIAIVTVVIGAAFMHATKKS